MPINHGPTGGVSLTGPAIGGFRALHCKHSLKLWAEHGIKTHRGFTVRGVLAIATEYTGTPYPASKAGARQAVADLSAALTRGLDAVGEGAGLTAG